MTTSLITGANRGIGLEISRKLAARGERVFAVCRTASDSLRNLEGDVHLVEDVDVTDAAAIARVVEALADAELDLLVNNAGMGGRTSLENFDLDSMRQQFEVNALGPLRMTHALLGNLRAGSKVAFVSSRMGSIGDNTSGGRYGYRMSKSALNMGAVSLARDLADRHIAVAILHPGFVRTDMTRGAGNLSADEAAGQLIERIDALSIVNTGTFWHAKGEVLPW